MRKLILINTLLILFTFVSVTVTGQYTGSYPNVAAFKSVTASDSVMGNGPSKALDTSLVTYCSIPGDAPAWIQIDLGTPYMVDGFGLVIPNVGELPTAITFQASLDGGTWFDLEDFTIGGTGEFTYNLTFSGDFQYIKFNMTAKDALASIAELYVYGYEILPPGPPLAMAATNHLSDGFTANWSDIGDATGFRFDVATDIDFMNMIPGYADLDVGNVTSLEVTGLMPVTTYYYRVRSYNNGGIGASSNIVSVKTGKEDQTITFEPLTPVVYGDGWFLLDAAASSGLEVSFSSSADTVAAISGDTVKIMGAGTVMISAAQPGNDTFNAAIPVEQELVVGKKELTVTGTTAETKEYDGTTDAALSGSMLEGILGMDEVFLANATSGMFAQAGVGSGIAVTTAMTLTGADTINYSLVQPTGITGDITAKELTVSGAMASDKVYDGNTDAVLSGASLSGVIGDDEVNLLNDAAGTFAQAGVGTDIEVTAMMDLTGADADNYTLAQPAGITAAITPKDLMAMADDMSREECAPNPDFTVSYTGFIDTEDESVLISEAMATSDADETSGAGTYDINVSGGSADNYNLVYVSGILTVTPDATDPVLVVTNVTIQLNSEGTASITPADVVESADDNCGVADTTLSQTVFTTDDIGDIVVDVTISDAQGNTDSKFAIVTVEGSTGIFESAGIEVTCYPNPTNGRVQLDLNVNVDVLKVMDMTGKTLLRRTDLGMQDMVDLSAFRNGIYIFQLTSGEDQVHFKVVKK